GTRRPRRGRSDRGARRDRAHAFAQAKRGVVMSELFRKEAIQHASQRLEGTVIMASPLSVKTVGLLLAAVVFGASVFASSANYARKTSVAGFLVPDQGMIRVTAQAAGTLQAVMVKEGDIVEKGAQLAVLNLSTETSSGNSGETLLKGYEAESLAA